MNIYFSTLSRASVFLKYFNMLRRSAVKKYIYIFFFSTASFARAKEKNFIKIKSKNKN